MKVIYKEKAYRIVKFEKDFTRALKKASDLGWFNGIDFDQPQYKDVFYKPVIEWKLKETETTPKTMFFKKDLLHPILLIAVDPQSFNAHINHRWI